jgi:hypothetical protein
MRRVGNAYLLTILPLDNELVLKHHEIPLTLLIFHEPFQTPAEAVEEIAATNGDLLRRKQPDPAEARDNSLSLRRRRELAHFLDPGDKCAIKKVKPDEKKTTSINLRLVTAVSPTGPLRCLPPFSPFDEPVLRAAVQPPQFHQRGDELGEALISKGAPNDRLGLRNFVIFLERQRVAIRIRDKGKSRRDEVWLRMRHQFVSRDVSRVSRDKEGGRVEESEKDAPRGPRELVAERVAGRFGGWKATAV